MVTFTVSGSCFDDDDLLCEFFEEELLLSLCSLALLFTYSLLPPLDCTVARLLPTIASLEPLVSLLPAAAAICVEFGGAS